MRIGNFVEWWLAGKTEVLGENLPQCHFIHHKSQMTWPGANPGRRGGKSATNRLSYGTATNFATAQDPDSDAPRFILATYCPEIHLSVKLPSLSWSSELSLSKRHFRQNLYVFVSTTHSTCLIHCILFGFSVPTVLGELHQVPRYINLKNFPSNPLQVKYFPELFVFKHLKEK
jgi:hypothetical protein